MMARTRLTRLKIVRVFLQHFQAERYFVIFEDDFWDAVLLFFRGVVDFARADFCRYLLL